MAAARIPAENMANLLPGPDAFQRPSTPILYRLWLLPAALIMLALPALYVALVALAAYAVYYHGTHHLHPIMAWGGMSLNWRLQLIKLAVYLGPLLGGAMMVFFMIKPLFARQPKPQP